MNEEMLEVYEYWIRLKNAVMTLFKKLARMFANHVIDKLEIIKRFIKKREKRIPVPKQTFPRQSAIIMRTQVMNRKPLMVRARTYC
jgi:hypothetical protein